MKTVLVLGFATITAGAASFALTAGLLGPGVAPASAGADPRPRESLSPVAAPAPTTPPALPIARADHATSSALPWRPEAQGLPRPLTPTDVPAYLEQTPILQLGIREGLLDRRLAITYHPDTAIIAAELRLRPDPRQREFAQLLAHSIVALVQALELPIRAIQLKITDAAGRPQLTAHIGLDTARTRPPATWEPTAAGTRAFLVWAAEGRAATALAERVTLTQAWAQ